MLRAETRSRKLQSSPAVREAVVVRDKQFSPLSESIHRAVSSTFLVSLPMVIVSCSSSRGVGLVTRDRITKLSA
uniref:CBS domain-containing protein n=1 Tax=Steinernema glaseri TaxID=37863 RepID=A0A1I8A3C3_9BILA